MKTKLMVAMLMMATMTTTAMAQQQGRGKSVELKKAQVEQFQRRDLSKKDMMMRQQISKKDIMRQKMIGKDRAMQIKDQRGVMAMAKKPVMSDAMRRKLFMKQLRQKKLMCKHCGKDFHHMHHHHHHA